MCVVRMADPRRQVTVPPGKRLDLGTSGNYRFGSESAISYKPPGKQGETVD
jgi:hypothetical protein